MNKEEDRLCVVRSHERLFTELIIPLTNTSLSWFQNIEEVIRKATSKDFKDVRQMTLGGKHELISGPHHVDVLYRNAPSLDVLLTILIGEVHGNKSMCASHVATMFEVLTTALMTTNNLFLILENFFHVIPRTVRHLKELSGDLQKPPHNERSIWMACGCISKGLWSCKVGSKTVGQLTLFRAFSFIAQATVIVLEENGIRDSHFHRLESRIHHMDLREDINMKPYEWLDKADVDRYIQRTLTGALRDIPKFTPKLWSEDLNKMYQQNVVKPLEGLINRCLQAVKDGDSSLAKRLYEEVFVSITEFVSLSAHFSIMERHNNPHIMVVVGDTHRQLISRMLRDCLKGNIKYFESFGADVGNLSCTRVTRETPNIV